ncbi:MAG: AAA family ATPase [Proteobacteria bacterium]|nr:AAA family ATPase [Pseudomonadota bacterium]MCG2743166.1 AAA family ATPase [Desulfobacteraceae bacterium]MBU3984595.1 AAA family ATPase [Pseudomonadota bacterium]MBU4028591.1 AAA family ATPase [Pseudomonadota bacterium]MBU4043518.1 AAA family ATPase [Pseudomonadota bacterium]
MAATGKVLVFFGMIATGKSYLAAAWARQHGCGYYNSDRVRKEIAGLAPESRQSGPADQGIYNHEFSRKTYDQLLILAEQDLDEGPMACVVLDGSYQACCERELVQEKLAAKAKVFFVHCICPEEVMRERMEQRQNDPQAVSDGRWEIYLQQKTRFEMPSELGPEQLLTIDTNQALDVLLVLLEEWMVRVVDPQVVV